MNLQVINAVWGKKYIDNFLRLSLPTQFSTGNLKALKTKPNYILYTNQSGQAQILQSAIYQKLVTHTNVTFRLIDIDNTRYHCDILLQCHSNAIKEANKLNAPLVLLSPDCLLSLNVFSYLVKAIERKKRLVAICSARMILEDYKTIIHNKEGSVTDEVHWTSQDLAKITITNLHYRGRCLLMGGDKIAAHPSQMYWKLNDNNLLAKCFHIHPLLIWPKVHNVYPAISADGKDFLEIICPNKSHWEVVEDCSEISLVEISSNKQFTSDVQVPTNPYAFKKWVHENTSAAHLYFLQHNIILGDSIREPHWDDKIAEANQFILYLLKIKPSAKYIKNFIEKLGSNYKVINTLSNYYQSHLIAHMDKDFFKWHFMLIAYVITGKKKLTWKKVRNHFTYLFKYTNYPVHFLQLTNKEKPRHIKKNQESS